MWAQYHMTISNQTQPSHYATTSDIAPRLKKQCAAKSTPIAVIRSAHRARTSRTVSRPKCTIMDEKSLSWTASFHQMAQSRVSLNSHRAMMLNLRFTVRNRFPAARHFFCGISLWYIIVSIANQLICGLLSFIGKDTFLSNGIVPHLCSPRYTSDW